MLRHSSLEFGLLDNGNRKDNSSKMKDPDENDRMTPSCCYCGNQRQSGDVTSSYTYTSPTYDVTTAHVVTSQTQESQIQYQTQNEVYISNFWTKPRRDCILLKHRTKDTQRELRRTFHWSIGRTQSLFAHICASLLVCSVILSPAVNANVIRMKRSPVTQADVNFLSKFGYMEGGARESASLMNQDDLSVPIRRLQKFAGIPQTGIIDHRTKALMMRPRCGNPDIIFPTPFHRRVKRFVIASSKWHHTNLTFRIVNFTPDLSVRETRLAVFNALNVWAKVTNLDFTEVIYGQADIMIQFTKRYHKDGYPFDGQGMVLAHAFFPGNRRGGDTHFDDDEHWTLNSGSDGVDLFMVAAHEFGHALGLAHSNRESALMFPWYHGYQDNYQLPEDDTHGIQHLYGERRTPARATPPPRMPVMPTRPPDSGPVTTIRPFTFDPEGSIPNPCTMDYDAVAVIRGQLHIFREMWYWRLEEKGVISGYPIQIRRFWADLPSNLNHVDAVYVRPGDGHIVFFIGNLYWVFDTNVLAPESRAEGRPITDFGLPPDIQRIDAAYEWSFNHHVYLMSGDMYWKLDSRGRVIYDYPRDTSIWAGVPTPVHSALLFQGKTYFFNGPRYWEFDDDKMHVKTLDGEKSSTKWLKCDNNAYNVQNADNSDPRINLHLKEDSDDSNIKSSKNINSSANKYSNLQILAYDMLLLTSSIILIY